MSYTLKCPKCGKILMGIQQASCPKDVMCPNCLKSGVVIYMIEDQNSSSYKNIGGGLFINKNKLS